MVLSAAALGLSVVASSFGLLQPAFASTPPPIAPVVKTSDGPVVGAFDRGVAEFLGVPYAATTAGANRWRPPQPIERSSTPLSTTSFAQPCAQTAQAGPASDNENCLALNIYAPRTLRGKHPVLVFLHGGANTGGSSNAYTANLMPARTGAVVVGVNYRLGFLGFGALPGLNAENSHGSSGNYGLLDQQAALRWIKRNIASFGGDPREVTLFGQSAGAIDTIDQLVSPEAKGLFERAISESLVGPGATETLDQATADSIAAINRADEPPPNGVDLGCPTTVSPAALVACLRAASIAKLATIASPGPIIDGYVVPRQPIEAFASGHFNHVPVVLGSNHDEGTLLFFVSSSVPSQAAFDSAIGERFGAANEAAIVSRYPARRYRGSFTQALAAAVGDALIACNTEAFRRVISPYVPTYGYEFNQLNPALLLPVSSAPGIIQGDTHTSELAYVFGFSARGALGPSDLALSKKFMTYWVRFAQSGDPNVPMSQHASGIDRLPKWHLYHGRRPMLLSLGTPVEPESVASFDAVHNCEFWNARLG
ncbi:MAG: carboxylesterase/lipase family protein [Acidimicrobiales bacterium]